MQSSAKPSTNPPLPANISSRSLDNDLWYDEQLPQKSVSRMSSAPDPSVPKVPRLNIPVPGGRSRGITRPSGADNTTAFVACQPVACQPVWFCAPAIGPTGPEQDDLQSIDAVGVLTDRGVKPAMTQLGPSVQLQSQKHRQCDAEDICGDTQGTMCMERDTEDNCGEHQFQPQRLPPNFKQQPPREPQKQNQSIWWHLFG